MWNDGLSSVPQLIKVSKGCMMRGGQHVEMLLLRWFVINVVLRATRVMPATVMKRNASDVVRKATLLLNASVETLFAIIVMKKDILALSALSLRRRRPVGGCLP